jgi:2Fe-2S ferredoxin
MPAIVFITPEGDERRVEAKVGVTIRDAALNHAVPGILGDCGGFCNCGTCHAYVDAAWLAHLPPASASEALMLEGTASPARANSRLCCQLPMTEALDGVVVRLPPLQI